VALFTKRKIGGLAVLGLLGLAGFWGVTRPKPLDASALPQHTADLKNGERLFHASGCHSCHLPSKDSGLDTASVAGGTPMHTPIGTLYPPNITPDKDTGIGNWTDIEFVNAMQMGISKNGSHLIPAFPYTSYAKMKTEDVLDVKAYLMSLAPVKNAVPHHDVLGLAIVRFGLGGWKMIGFSAAKHTDDAAQTPAWNRGKYLVDGAGHCAECHTPRTMFMTSDQSQYLAGGPHPEGNGKVPSLRDLVGRGKYKDVADLTSAFQFGEMMGYSRLSSGGMGKVQTNLSKLPEEDVKAIAEYLLSLK
jgi:mono/diheme cytochrome c family protein